MAKKKATRRRAPVAKKEAPIKQKVDPTGVDVSFVSISKKALQNFHFEAKYGGHSIEFVLKDGALLVDNHFIGRPRQYEDDPDEEYYDGGDCGMEGIPLDMSLKMLHALTGAAIKHLEGLEVPRPNFNPADAVVV